MRLITVLIIGIFVDADVFGFYEVSSWNIAACPRQVSESVSEPGFGLGHMSAIYIADGNDMAIAGILRDFIKDRFCKVHVSGSFFYSGLNRLASLPIQRTTTI